MNMFTKSGRYFGEPFKGQCGMHQGYLLSPTIFNVVVDAVFRHQVTVLIATEGTAVPDIEGFEQYIQWMAAYLYADNKLLASTRKHGYIRHFLY